VCGMGSEGQPDHMQAQTGQGKTGKDSVVLNRREQNRTRRLEIRMWSCDSASNACRVKS
jgi:hypothetical protein